MAKNTFWGFPFLLLVLLCALVLSCATKKPAVNQQPAGETPETASSEEEPESSSYYEADAEAEAFEKPAYERTVILEGSSSHRVMWGDTLSKLAIRYYGRGNGYYFPLIMLASQGAVRDPDRIISGRVLTVPDLRRNLDDPDSRQLLKEYINEVVNIYAAKPQTKWSGRIRNQLRALASTL